MVENIYHINFLSYGPVAQYRNKFMFYVLGCNYNKCVPIILNHKSKCEQNKF